MISQIRGKLLSKNPPNIILDVNGIGYEISIPMTNFYKLPQVSEEVSLFTHYVVREDAQLLYGFLTSVEKSLFCEVIKANGVGPKLGLAILSSMNASEFCVAISEKNTKQLLKIPGIGKRTADRLIVELADKLEDFNTELAGLNYDVNLSENNSNIESEAVNALVSLGYRETDSRKTVKNIFKQDFSLEDTIKYALKSMIN